MEPVLLGENEKLVLSLLANSAERTLLGRALASLNGTTHSGNRDLYEIFGYRRKLTPEDYLFNYQRGDIAKRIVTAYPDATWSMAPEVLDDESDQNETEFEKAFKALAKRLKLFSYIKRLDILSQLGSYSILLMGVEGGGELNTPRPAGAKVKYIMPYGEANVKIKSFETNTADPRFGKPLMYELTLLEPTSDNSAAQKNSGGKTKEVHHSRVIHVADNLLENDVFGQSILSAVYNRLEDLNKVVGGSAETFWLNSRGGLNLAAEKDVTVMNPEKVKQDATDYINQLTRMLTTQGMDVKPIEMMVHSPKEHAEVLLSIISGTTGIPKRILMGSESSELASSQDANNWADRVEERQTSYCDPFILAPIIWFFIDTGDLPKPKDETFVVKWQSIATVSETDKSLTMQQRSKAIKDYADSPNAEFVVTPQQFVEEVLQMEYRAADIAILEAEREAEELEEEKKMKAAGINPLTGKPDAPPPAVTKLPSPGGKKAIK